MLRKECVLVMDSVGGKISSLPSSVAPLPLVAFLGEARLAGGAIGVSMVASLSSSVSSISAGDLLAWSTAFWSNRLSNLIIGLIFVDGNSVGSLGCGALPCRSFIGSSVGGGRAALLGHDLRIVHASTLGARSRKRGSKSREPRPHSEML